MELEEMQAAWTAMSSELEQQKLITNDLIMKMTQSRYKNHWNKIALPDKVFSVISFITVIALLLNFKQLDTLPLQICGLISIPILIILPIFSIKTIRDLQQLNITQHTYKETMEAYAKSKKRFVNFQKINMAMSFVFMIVSIPVLLKFLKGENLFETLNMRFIYALPVCFFLFFLMLRYITRINRSMLKNSEKILKEIKE